MSTHNIPYQYKKRKSTEIFPNTIMPAVMRFFFVRDSTSQELEQVSRGSRIPPASVTALYIK